MFRAGISSRPNGAIWWHIEAVSRTIYDVGVRQCRNEALSIVQSYLLSREANNKFASLSQSGDSLFRGFWQR
jgi:hypothetical protein